MTEHELMEVKLLAYCQAISAKYGLHSEQDVSHIFCLHQREAPARARPKALLASPAMSVLR